MSVTVKDTLWRTDLPEWVSVEADARRAHKRPTGIDGYLLPTEAAAQMGVTVEELERLVRGGYLSTLRDGETLLVRPAKINVVRL